jgi:hypothetical protein
MRGLFESLIAVRGTFHRVSFVAQAVADRHAQRFFILDK